MKILNVNMSLDPVTGGGSVERTFQMSRSLVKQGIDCTVLTTDIGLTPERIKGMDGVNVIALTSLYKRFYIPVATFSMIKAIVKNTDIIHLMNHWTLLNIIVYFFAKRLKKPYVVCPAGSLPIYGRSKIKKNIYNLLIGNKIILNADGHVAIGTNEINQFLTYGVDPHRVILIPNGVNVEDFHARDVNDFRRKFGLGSTPYLMFMGRLNDIKGPDLLLQAFCNLKYELKNYHLVFAGPDDGMLDRLKAKVEEFDLRERVHFFGYLSGVDKSQAYYAAELLVIPSRQEAMSIVVLEAGITGTPVLITDQCGFDKVDHIGGGRVVPASVDGIQKGLVEILSNSKQLKQMGENLKKYIYKDYTWDAIIDKYINLYYKILNKDV